MGIIILASLIVSAILIVLIRFTLKNFKKDDEETSVLEMRKKQSVTSFRENALKRKLEKLVEDRAKKGKKFDIEEMCLQAGFEISYGEYRLISYFTAIILFIATIAGLQNFFMGIVAVIIGLFAPGQIIQFIRNKRINKLEKQVGSFMRLLIERYHSNRDFARSIQDCVDDFKGQEPIYTELIRTSADINIGVPVAEAMHKLVKRTGNPYLARMADYYEIASDLGTTETRDNLLRQALTQFEENRSMKSKLRNELNGPIREAYIMVTVVPFIALYMAVSTPEYTEFMLHSFIGQVGSAVIIATLLGCIWFINKQIGKPLD